MLRYLGWLVWLFVLPTVNAQAPALQTAAERTQHLQTTRHAEVLQFCEQLSKLSPKVKLTTYGSSVEGMPLPLMILSDSGVATPAEAAQLKRPVLLAFANIHAGEVDGKEALLALARDLAFARDEPLLKSCVILLAPNINPDGNEKISDQNRRSQNGPPAVGTRANATGLDLNRDFVKLESPEIRSLVRLINTWDPLLIIDCHTTNGSRHRYTLTYDGPSYPAADSRLIGYTRNTLLPKVSETLKKRTGFESFFYGNFSADRTLWETYPATPRFSTQYFALRNRIALLSESYSYASFRDRIQASYHFVKSSFEHVATHHEAIQKLVLESEKPRKRVALRAKATAFNDPVVILGFDEKQRDKPKDYELKFVGDMSATLEVELPAAYLLPGSWAAVAQTLRRHGIQVEELREDLLLDLEAYKVQEIQRTETPFQKHRLISLEVAREKKTRMIRAGTYLIRCNQRLGSLAAYLLEPQSEDGLATWNAFDESIEPNGEYPVLRMLEVPPMTTGAPRPLPEDRVMNKSFTVDLLIQQQGGAGRRGTGDVTQTWLADGEHFTQVKAGVRWKIHAATGKAERIVDQFADSLKNVTKSSRGRPGGFARAGGVISSADQKLQLHETPEGLFLAFANGKPATKLKLNPGKREFTTFSPSGKHIAFAREGNLFAVNLETLAELPLTKDGGGEVLNGRADWVYEEEIFNRNGQAYWWSDDGSSIAFLRFDDKPVKRFTLADSFPTQGRGEVYAYPKPGDPNPLVTLAVVEVSTGKRVDLDLTGYKPEDTLIARVGWMPGKNRVFAYVQNRVQTWLDFAVWDLNTQKRTRLFRDSTKAWIDDPGQPEFLPNGSFLFFSERSGWKHLYHYAEDGNLIRPVTSGEWEVKSIHRIDPEAGVIYLSGTKDGHTGSDLYRTCLDGTRIDRLTPEAGTHTVSLAPRGDLFIDRFTDRETPTRTTLRKANGTIVRVLDSNPVYEREEYQLGKFERVQVPMKDGFLLEAAIVYPPNFDPKQKYPIWISTYAGPHAPTVREGWSWRAFEQVLATNGIISFRVDPRSASGKGAVSAWACYKKMGVSELQDLEEAVDWICKNSWADSKKVGISGHSYGGFMTAYALTHSQKFAAGISGAPPTDWRLYDTIYTERYMGLPAENKEGYEATSCITAASKLHGKLLLVHGAMDDNVHMQNSMQFVDALQRAGKPFELMIYPRSRHGIISPHYTRLQFDFITRVMK